MKHKLVLLLLTLYISFSGFCQVQATIKQGSRPNSIYVTFKSAVTLTAAKFSTFQFAVGIPTSQTAGLSLTVVSSDVNMAYDPLNTTETQNGVSYSAYSFSGDGAQAGTGTTYTAGVEYNYAEVFINGGNITLNDVRLLQIPDGGSKYQVNFYLADKGTDVTNQTAQFYSSNSANVVNDGAGYAGSSYVKMGGVVLPVKFTAFSAIKKDNNAVLNWQVENESSLANFYEIERSLNDVDFKYLATLQLKNNGSTSNNYIFTDMNLNSICAACNFNYRIKQVDKDGHFIYSEIKSIRLAEQTFAVSVFPNPIKNITTVTINNNQHEDANITINDASGKLIQTMQINLFKGINTKQINMGAFAVGNYLLKVKTAKELKTINLVKIK